MTMNKGTLRKWGIKILPVLLAVLVLSGCVPPGSGLELPTDQQAKLSDLYTGATGTLVHLQIERFVRDQLLVMSGNNRPVAVHMEYVIPYTRLKADVAARYSNRREDYWRIWEIKPYKHMQIDNLMRQWTGQMTNYAAKMTQGGLGTDIRFGGGGIAYPTPGIAIPDSYTPQEAAKCLQVRIETSATDPGKIGYWYAWHPNKTMNGRACKNQETAVKHQLLADFVRQAADVVRQQYGSQNAAGWRAAEINYEDIAAISRANMLEIRYFHERSGWNIDGSINSDVFHDKLMRKTVPDWFYDPRPSTRIPWPGIQQGDPWECSTPACAAGADDEPALPAEKEPKQEKPKQD